MDCRTVQERLGAFLDGELSDRDQDSIGDHLSACSDCTTELEKLQSLVDCLHSGDQHRDVKAPSHLWSSIEQQLDRPVAQPVHRHPLLRYFRKPITAAASLALLLGIGTLVGVWISSSVPEASAETVDYSILLDGVADDVDASFSRFLGHYHAKPIPVSDAQAAAPGLSFALPPELIGQYRLDKVYQLRFGKSPGVAAHYRGKSGPLIIFFHTPAKKGILGVHKEMACHVGDEWGHRTDIGQWKLIHFTDPTTCHCLLSTLDPEAEVPAVFAAVAPKFSDKRGGHEHK